MYYLNSRYYNQQWGRFINSDAFSVILNSPYSLTDKNQFVYCDNNPILRKDDGGEFWHILIGAAVGAIVGGAAKAITNVATGKKWSEGVGLAAAAGALSGALAATGLPPIVQIVGSAFISGGESVLSQGQEKGFDNIDYGEVVLDTVIGGIAGRNAGLGKGEAKHMMKQGVKATKRIFKSAGKEAKKAVKYYFSQTTTMFYEPLVKNAIADVIKSPIIDSVKYYGMKGLERYLP